MSWTLHFSSFPPPGGPLAIAPVPWDSELFGFPFYELRAAEAAPEALAAPLRAGLDGLPRGRPCLVVAGLPPDAVALARILTGAGFYPVETLLKIELPLARFRPAVTGRRFQTLRFRPASELDLPALQAIARSAFAADRLHLDPNLPPERADERYARWLANSLKAGEALFVLDDTRRGGLAGFVLAVRPAPDVYDVTLAALAPAHHHSGAGLWLYQALLQEAAARGLRRVLATISINNLNSLKAAERLGFTAASSVAKYHWFRPA